MASAIINPTLCADVVVSTRKLISQPVTHPSFPNRLLLSRSTISSKNLTNRPCPSQAAAPSTSRNIHAHRAATQPLRSVNVLSFLSLSLFPIRANESNRPCRQLGPESQAKKDNRNRPHAYAQNHFTQVPEWVPDWCTQGCKGAYNLEIRGVYLLSGIWVQEANGVCYRLLYFAVMVVACIEIERVWRSRGQEGKYMSSAECSRISSPGQ